MPFLRRAGYQQQLYKLQSKLKGEKKTQRSVMRAKLVETGFSNAFSSSQKAFRFRSKVLEGISKTLFPSVIDTARLLITFYAFAFTAFYS